MPKLKKVSAKIKVNESPLNVFDAVTDWESQEKWIFATKVKGIGDNSHKLGGKLEAFTGFGRIGFLDTMTITNWIPPQLCEVTHTGKIVKGSGVFEIKTENGETIFSWTEYTILPFGLIGEIAWLIVGPLTKLGLWISLKRFSSFYNY